MISDRVLHGAVTLVFATLAKRGLDLATMIVLARLLTPADFGLVTLSLTVMLIFMAISELAISDALVQMPQPTEQHYQAAWTLSVLRGIIVASAMSITAFPLSLAYGDPRLFPITCALAVPPLLRSSISPRMATFTRALSFKQEMVVEVGSKLCSLVIAASVAFLTRSYWAIVSGQVAAAAAFCIATYVFAPIRPRLTVGTWREFMHFSVWISLQRMTNALSFYVDRFLVAGFLGKSELGHYVIGNDWSALPTQTVQMPLSKVIFAGLASFRDDLARLRQAYLAGQAACAAALVPIGLGMSLVAKPLVLFAIGPAWLDAVPIIQVLSPIFAVQALVAPAQAVVMARNTTRLAFNRDLTNLFIRLPLIFAGTYFFGLNGLLAARTIAGLNMALMSFGMVKRAIGLPIMQQIWSGRRSIGAGLAMYAVVTVLQRLWFPPAEKAPLIALTASIGVGAFVYVFSHWLLWRLEGRPSGPESRVLTVAKKFVR